MRTAVSMLPLILLAACGGGGSGGGTPAPSPAPANQAPVFTSGTTASVVENTAAAYQATATDANGNAITFSISGGADAARFSITNAGALSFVTAPNFEAPADAGADNVYNVQLRASDGMAGTTLDLAVTVTNSREGISVVRVGTGFNQPVYVAPIPGSSDVYVVEKTGGIWRFDPATGSKTLTLTVGNLSTDGERGLLGLAVNTISSGVYGSLFAVATAPDGTIEVRAYYLPGGATRNVLTIPHPGASNHNGGWIGFGPDNNLYVGVGDGGGSGDPANNAQNPNVRLGKILRIGLVADPFAGTSPRYNEPAAGNPYIGGGGDPYVFALGLRNPYRASFGPDGRLYIGDVGQGEIEEIDVLRPDQPGLNFGWRFLEGTMPYSGTAPAGLTDPVSQYAHGSGPTQGASIIGGYVYRGPVTSLQGSYVFADYVSNNLWTIPGATTNLVQGSLFPAGSYERRNLDFTPDAGTLDQIVSFGEDDAGNLFIVGIDGEIFMVRPG